MYRQTTIFSFLTFFCTEIVFKKLSPLSEALWWNHWTDETRLNYTPLQVFFLLLFPNFSSFFADEILFQKVCLLCGGNVEMMRWGWVSLLLFQFFPNFPWWNLVSQGGGGNVEMMRRGWAPSFLFLLQTNPDWRAG